MMKDNSAARLLIKFLMRYHFVITFLFPFIVAAIIFPIFYVYVKFIRPCVPVQTISSDQKPSVSAPDFGEKLE